ncbi:NUDIX hydrolase [Halalkalibacillus halophilus]|uniref:NUDIX hydrolase n=1 Tax=Halalkalibacillus halophilus TaxID=392827 RepID=UPI0004206C35|nr:NUDIX domain-containing protein [Halalkalibacillus halophilus]
MEEEYWNLLDENREDTGEVHKRGEPIPEHRYHLVVRVWIKNAQGEFLMSKRHPDKPEPFKWEATGGSVTIGEDSLTGAIREVKEELGLTLNSAHGELMQSVLRKQHQSFYDVWLFEAEAEINELTLQHDEVVDVKWMTTEEIERLHSENQLLPTLDYFRQMIHASE